MKHRLPVILAELFLLAGGPAAATRAAAPPPGATVVVTRVIVRSHMVVRVEAAPPPPAALRERKGPRCVPLSGLAGSAVVAPNSIDLALRDGRRVRARFDASCPGLDYYSGFYVVPDADGMMCAGRDVVRDRAGGECPVAQLRRLEPRK